MFNESRSCVQLRRVIIEVLLRFSLTTLPLTAAIQGGHPTHQWWRIGPVPDLIFGTVPESQLVRGLFMGSAEPAAQFAKRLRKRISLRSLLAAHEEVFGSQDNHGQAEKMSKAEATSSMNNIGLDLQLRMNRLHALPEGLEESAHGSLWGVRLKYLLIVELVFGSMIGVLLGMATYDTPVYWWIVHLLLG
jgi:hypothetical protein